MQTMITIDFKTIDRKRKALKITKADLARRVNLIPDTYLHFEKSGKQLSKHINIIDKICKELDIDLNQVIK